MKSTSMASRMTAPASSGLSQRFHLVCPVPRSIRHRALRREAAADSGFIGSKLPSTAQSGPGKRQAASCTVDSRINKARQAVSTRSNHAKMAGFGLRGSMVEEGFGIVEEWNPIVRQRRPCTRSQFSLLLNFICVIWQCLSTYSGRSTTYVIVRMR